MSQIFHPSTNTIAKVSILGGLFILSALVWAMARFNTSPFITQVGVARDQPIPFSHKHHVQGLGMDCRYCHTSVEQSNFAGIPSTSVCMNCHTVIWKNAAVLKPLRESFRTGQPIEWTRVHDLPDYVYFNHSIHIQKGVGCVTCHGQVNEMPLTWRVHNPHMEWCLSCHRQPQKSLRPLEEVFNMNWIPPKNLEALQKTWAKERGVRSLTNCTTCHR